MHFGRIRQEGRRGSEKDGEIGMCVVVHACVGRCQQGNQPSSDIVGSVGAEGYKTGEPWSRTRGYNEVDTPVLDHCPKPGHAANQRTIAIDIKHSTTTTPSSLSLSPTSASYISSISKIPCKFPLNSLSLSRGLFTNRKCSLELWFTCEPRLARILRQ